MYLFIFYGTVPPEAVDADCMYVDVEHLYQKKDENEHLYQIDPEEFSANGIADSLDDAKYKAVKGVVINKALGGRGGWGRALRLAGHIVTKAYVHCDLNSLPIVLTDINSLDLRDDSLYGTVIRSPFAAGGFYFKTHDELFKGRPNPLTDETGLVSSLRGLDAVNSRKLNIGGPEDSRHQATNEWGAMRLAANFGVGDEIAFKYPRHLYFKYLALQLQQNVVSPAISPVGLFTKALLIDDHAVHGWQEVLAKILGCAVRSMVPTEADTNWQTEDLRNYDLIFLDLYLENSTNKDLSLKILDHIKKKYPQIPVIIFTASEKALNMEIVLDRGADGMYIKESPIHLNEAAYSQENSENFKAIVKEAHRKYKVLRPYWNAIEAVLSNANFCAIENTPRKFRERLEERLKMFYGLLKKGFEQSEYDERTFFYSDYELAFMTLWSMLNEIQEMRFSKTSSGGNEEWKFKHWVYLRFNRTSFDTDLVQLPHWFSTDTKEQKKWKFRQQISLQITFLIEKMNPANKIALFQSIKDLNDARNKLYLTHADNANSSFFTQTEAQKRAGTTDMTPSGKIKELFDLIVYLLTEDEALRVVI